MERFMRSLSFSSKKGRSSSVSNGKQPVEDDTAQTKLRSTRNPTSHKGALVCRPNTAASCSPRRGCEIPRQRATPEHWKLHRGAAMEVRHRADTAESWDEMIAQIEREVIEQENMYSAPKIRLIRKLAGLMYEAGELYPIVPPPPASRNPLWAELEKRMTQRRGQSSKDGKGEYEGDDADKDLDLDCGGGHDFCDRAPN